jgi:MraZ protein
MFSGEFEYTMDGKGRVFLPAKWREDLSAYVRLCRWTEAQLNIFSNEVWLEMAQNLARLNPARRVVSEITRSVYSAVETEIDSQGRILIPPPLRRYAGLQVEVVLVGVNSHMEIWSQERWQDVMQRWRTTGAKTLEEFADSGQRLY